MRKTQEAKIYLTKQINMGKYGCEIDGHGERKDAVDNLKKVCTEENLWNCIVAFQGYLFYTSSGLPFTHTLKVGKNGAFIKELFIDRREHSKSLAWSSVRIAFEKVLEKKDTAFH